MGGLADLRSAFPFDSTQSASHVVRSEFAEE